METENPNQLQDYVAQYGAAYEAHRATYVLRVPPPEKVEFREPKPEPPKWQLENTGTLTMLGLLVTASVIVSGSRTIPEFGDVGGPAFVMLEMGLITYAFIRTSRNYSQERHESLTHWVNTGMGMAFAVLLLANIDAVLTRRGFKLPSEVALIIDLFVAISAPVLAFISGDVMGMYSVMQRHNRKKALELFQEQLAQWTERRDAFEAAYVLTVQVWRDGLNASWNAAKRQLGVQLSLSARTRQDRTISDEAPVRPASVRTDRTGYGYERTSDAQQKALDWFGANPDKVMSTPLRDLEGIIGVSKTTIGEARKEWQRQQILALSANGNGHSEAGHD